MLKHSFDWRHRFPNTLNTDLAGDRRPRAGTAGEACNPVPVSVGSECGSSRRSLCQQVQHVPWTSISSLTVIRAWRSRLFTAAWLCSPNTHNRFSLRSYFSFMNRGHVMHSSLCVRTRSLWLSAVINAVGLFIAKLLSKKIKSHI